MNVIDFLIIGSGPGGTAAALKLLEGGHRVTILERGDFLPREKSNRDSSIVYGEKRYRTSERWCDENGQSFQPWMHYCVGGNAKLYGAALYRFREADFGALEYADGISPAWPISYQDLAPYYDEAEALYRVHGDRTADVTEPTDRPYPLPPLDDEPVIARLRTALERQGVSQLPLPLGVALEHESDGWKTDLTHFDAYPDPSLSKAEPEACLLERLESYGDKFTLLTRTEALAFTYTGRNITGVIVRQNEQTLSLRARHYISAAGAINSAKLFLQSDPARTFANRSDEVGRNYMSHLCTTASVRFTRDHGAEFAKTWGTNHWYRPDVGGDLFGSIQTQGKWDATQYELEDWAWDEGEEKDLEGIAARSLEFFFMTEDLPRSGNRISLRHDGRLQIDRILTGEQEHQKLIDSFRSSLEKMTDDSLQVDQFRSQTLPLAWCTHQCGTLRFGTDPSTSVLDTYCRAHDLDNLSVTDASFFPSSTALNPTLTIVANALRVGEHLSKNISTP